VFVLWTVVDANCKYGMYCEAKDEPDEQSVCIFVFVGFLLAFDDQTVWIESIGSVRSRDRYPENDPLENECHPLPLHLDSSLSHLFY
jgi:hypothetical protein